MNHRSHVVIKAIEDIDGSSDEAFEAALAKCENPLQSFIVELQHSVNHLVDKYSSEDTPSDLLILKGLPGGFAAMRISTLMRLQMPILVMAVVVHDMIREDMEMTGNILAEMAGGKQPNDNEPQQG